MQMIPNIHQFHIPCGGPSGQIYFRSGKKFTGLKEFLRVEDWSKFMAMTVRDTKNSMKLELSSFELF